MNESIVKKLVQEFSKDKQNNYKKAFNIIGNDEDIYVVTIERQRKDFVAASLSLEARGNTISAGPSGAPCTCCNGSGRS